VTSLLAFNVGVEIGQIVVLLVLVPSLGFLLRYLPERIGTVILSALVAHTGWHWMTERGEQWRKFPLPAIDAAAAASLLRWLMAAMVLASLIWLLDKWLTRWLRRRDAFDGKADEHKRVPGND
jgi:hypothetical protein